MVGRADADISNINIVEGKRIFYVDDIVAICRRENVPKLQFFKEELMKQFEIARPQRKPWLLCIIDWNSLDCLAHLHHLFTH